MEEQGHSTGLYIATALAKAALNNLPKLIWGDRPHTVISRLMSWTAPLAANIMGVFINLEMRKDTIERNRAKIEKLENEMEGMETQIHRLEK